MNIYLSELFSSIQGEGPFIGERHFFIRFSGCHRKCIFCDTNVKRTKKISIEKNLVLEKLNITRIQYQVVKS